MDSGDILLLITGVASPLIAAGVTLTVAVLRFGVGRSQLPPENPDGLTRQDLEHGFRDITAVMTAEFGRLEGQLSTQHSAITAQGQVLNDIKTILLLRQNPSDPPGG